MLGKVSKPIFPKELCPAAAFGISAGVGILSVHHYFGLYAAMGFGFVLTGAMIVYDTGLLDNTVIDRIFLERLGLSRSRFLRENRSSMHSGN